MLKNFNKEGQKLPLFGVGPAMIFAMGLTSLIGIILIGYVLEIGELYKPWIMVFRSTGIVVLSVIPAVMMAIGVIELILEKQSCFLYG